MNTETNVKTPPPETVEIAGTVSQLFFSKPTFCTGRLRSAGRDVSFSIKGFVKLGEPVTLRGKWTTHPKYGRQFEGAEVVYTLPADPAGLAIWLSWYVPDVGPVKGQRMIDEFGMDLTRLAAEDPQQVAALAAIPIQSVNRIAEAWTSFSAKIGAFTELAVLGLTQHEVETLFARFKGSAATILRTDPYMLLREVDGFGFARIDGIARKLGFPLDHPGRWRAALITAVADTQDKGSTVVPETVAIAKTADLLEIAEDEHSATLAGMAADAAADRKISRVATGDDSASGWNVGTLDVYRYESLLWRTLATARNAHPFYNPAPGGFLPELVQSGYSRIGDKKLDESQLSALTMAVSNRISFVTGGAGSGKTTIAKSIYKFFRDGDVPVTLCAPTGKAARRLTEVIGREAFTIHRLLGYCGAGFFHDETNPLPDGVIIADELSMVGSPLAYHLFRALGKRTALVCIGDPNQLPPVEPGAILRDVLDHSLAPVARLDKCHRQAGPLKANCAALLEGRVEPTVDGDPSPWLVHDQLDTPEKVLKGITALFKKYLPTWGYDPVGDTQFLTAQHKGPFGTVFLNRVCQRLRQLELGNELPEPKSEDDTKAVLFVGDKVIHTKNDYQLNVMNGTQGIVVATEPKLVVRYDDKDVEYPGDKKSVVHLSYVVTPHKYQGSEVPCAVTICPRQHSFMQHRNWIYTSCTRAQKTSVIIGDEQGIGRAVERVENDRRTTWLGLFARHEKVRPV